MAIVNFAWIRACVKARLLDDPDYPDQQKWKPKKEWKLHVECTSGLGRQCQTNRSLIAVAYGSTSSS